MDALRNIVHGHTGAAALRGTARGGRSAHQTAGGGALVHAHTVVGYGNQDCVVAVLMDGHVDPQGTVIAHAMPHGVLDNRLDYKGRDQRVLDILGDIEGRQYAVLAKARLLKGKVALGLGDLTRNRNQGTRVVERGTVERRELTQQLAGAQRIGARKRRDGVERVKQKVRIDLRLQGTNLGTGP